MSEAILPCDLRPTMDKILKAYLHQYYHLSICTALLCAFTYQATVTQIHWTYCVWVGVATLVMYSFFVLFKLSFAQLKAILINYPTRVIILPLVAMVGMIVVQFHWVESIALVIAGTVSLFYFRPVFGTSFSLRAHFLLKPLSIGLVFALSTAFVPYIHSGYLIGESVILSTGRLCFIMALALIFDLGDVVIDQETQTIAMPQKLGVVPTKVVASIILLVGGLIELNGAWTFLLELPALLALLVTYFFSFVLIIISGPKKEDWFYLLVVDGMIGLPFLLTMV
ncbi:MAG: hypothetical protein WAU01_11955 [Saprospiraceae bacterium]